MTISSDADQLQQRIADLCWKIVTAPDVARIRLSDPRFSWLPLYFEESNDVGNTIESLLTHLTKQAPTEQTLALLNRLRDYTQTLQDETIEGELFGIVAAAGDQAAVTTIMEELQWDGRPTDLSRSYGSYSKPTKELVSTLSLEPTWVPILDRALNVVKRAVPIKNEQIGPALKASGLVDSATFSALGLLNAQDIFRRPTRLRMTTEGVLVSEPTVTSPVKEPVVVTPRPTTTQPKPPASPQESPAVRSAIRDAVGRLHRGTGVAQIDEVGRLLRETGMARVSEEGIVAAVTRVPDLESLEGGWLGLIGGIEVSPLTRRLAKMLLACNRLPLDIAWYQLGRENQTYRHVPPAVIADFARKHPLFQIDSDRIELSSGSRVSQSTLLDPGESKLFTLLRRNSASISRVDIAPLLGHTTMSAAQRTELLRTSSLVVPMGNDRFTALGPSQTIFDRIRADHHAYHDQFPNTAPSTPQPVMPPSPVLEPTPEENGHPFTEPDSDPAHGELHVLSETTVSGQTTTVLRTIRELLDDIQKNRLRLPEIQRGYVWKSAQVRDLIDSLYRGYPVGTLLIWQTEERPASRSVSAGQSLRSHAPAPSSDGFILDGQQRLTSIFRAVVSGEITIVFNVINQTFRVTAARPTTTVTSIPIAEVFAHGPEHILSSRDDDLEPDTAERYRARLERLRGILERVIPVETLSGYSYEEVTDVFIRVNSRGTRLKTAELAIADIAYRLPGIVSDQISLYAEDLSKRGWDLPVQFLLRLVAAVGTKRVGFKNLSNMPDQELAANWERAQRALDLWLSLLEVRLSLSSGELLPGLNSHVVPVVWLAEDGNRSYDSQLLEWFVHSNVWSRYTGRTESNLDQDLRDLFANRRGNPFSPLMDRIRQSRSSLRVAPRDVEGAGQRSPLLLLMYLALAQASAEDLLEGLSLLSSDGGREALNAPAPIFTSASLRGRPRALTAHQLPNITLLRPGSAAAAGSRPISQFLEHIPKHRLEQHGIPLDSTLWTPEKYNQFTAQRARILVEQMNNVIKELSAGNQPATAADHPTHASSFIVNRSAQEGAIGFDEIRQDLFEEMAAQIQSWAPDIKPYNRTTYLGFSRGMQSMPFATVARLRRSMLSWVIDCKIKDIDDPRAWCRDVSKGSKYGYGETQFTIERSDQVPYALELIRQAFEKQRIR